MEREKSKETAPEAVQVWRHIYGPRKGHMALFTGERRAGGRLTSPRTHYFLYPDEIHEAANFVLQADFLAYDVYHAAHLFVSPLRRKETAAPVSSLYVDVDDGDLSNLPRPSLLVQSSPNRFQAYWRLSHAIRPERAEDYNRRLAQACGGDPSGWDLTQLMRIPGTRNFKYDDAPRVTVQDLRNISYAPGYFEKFAAPQEDVKFAPKMVQTRAELKGEVSHVLDGRVVVKKKDGSVDRSASLYLMALVLSGAGYPQDDILAILEDRDSALGWNKFSTRRDRQIRYQAIISAVQARTH